MSRFQHQETSEDENDQPQIQSRRATRVRFSTVLTPSPVGLEPCTSPPVRKYGREESNNFHKEFKFEGVDISQVRRFICM